MRQSRKLPKKGVISGISDEKKEENLTQKNYSSRKRLEKAGFILKLFKKVEKFFCFE